ncbi:MAG: hypothetical protein Q4E52_09550 [Fibrobacter sp.]|nr:hypothetical protein [Fibrobacter sp.]
MNFENMNALSQKVEGVLGTVRTLKQENAKVRKELENAKAQLQDKSILLDTANANIASLKSNLSDTNAKLTAVGASLTDAKAALDARVNQVNAQEQALNEKLVSIANLKNLAAEKDRDIAALNGIINEKIELLNALNAKVEEKDAIIAKLMDQLQAQSDEIADAQEKFNQLVATIENELGTDLSIEEPSVETDDVQEAEEAADEVEQAPAQEDLPTIEVHGAEEKEESKSRASGEGSQTSFFD